MVNTQIHVSYPFDLLQSNDVNLDSERKSPPRLIIGIDNGNITTAVIVADGIKLDVLQSSPVNKSSPICTMLLNLVSAY